MNLSTWQRRNESGIPGRKKGPQARAYLGTVRRPLCQRSVWGQGSSGGPYKDLGICSDRSWRFWAEMVTASDLGFTGSLKGAELRLQ